MQVYDRVIAAGEQTSHRPVPANLREIFWNRRFTDRCATSWPNAPDMDVGGGQTPVRILLALIDGNYAEAERVLAASPREDFQDIDFSFYFPKSLV